VVRATYLLVIGVWRLVLFLRRERPTILQTWLYHADLLGLLAAKLARVPVVAWNVRCTNLRAQRGAAIRILARLSVCPQAVLVNSVAGRRFHESQGYHPRNWIHIPNGFDLEEFRPDPHARLKLRQELQLPEEALLIGLIARIDPLKDHTNFLQAADLLLQKYPRVHFVNVGFGADRQNRKLRCELEARGLSDRVHLLGERSDISHVMAALDILASSSSAEGFPNVVGEAMACGVPCVVTDVGDAALLVGDTGKVVPPRNPEALANAWAELIDLGPDGRRRLGEAARQRINEHFNLDTIVQHYERCYDELAAAAARVEG
jgi:glycosyltransferase involved in cell wall biosynthesis